MSGDHSSKTRGVEIREVTHIPTKRRGLRMQDGITPRSGRL